MKQRQEMYSPSFPFIFFILFYVTKGNEISSMVLLIMTRFWIVARHTIPMIIINDVLLFITAFFVVGFLFFLLSCCVYIYVARIYISHIFLSAQRSERSQSLRFSIRTKQMKKKNCPQPRMHELNRKRTDRFYQTIFVRLQ